MAKNLFTSLIKCENCNYNYRFIKERGVNKYVCQGYSTGKSNCNRYIIQEKELLYIISIFCNRNHIQLEYTHNFMKGIISKIYIDGENDSIRIIYKNGEKGIYSKHEIHI